MKLKGLNMLQQKAVTSDHKRLLVLAGAGSGKTKTLISRLNWLLLEKNVKPGNILAITFTKNAANEMVDRMIEFADHSGEFASKINNKGMKNAEKDIIRKQFKSLYPWVDNVTICTFHSLCYRMLREKGVHQFDNKFKVITHDKSQLDDFKNKCPENIMGVMQKVMFASSEKPAFLLQLKRYILDYYVDKIHFEPTRSNTLYQKSYTTLNGDKVRSKSEQFIADWLYRHQIKYVYEPGINLSDFNFKPDFYIPEANLYLEHISDLSKNMQDKEEQFKKAGKRFARTNEKMAKDSRLFSSMLNKIVRGALSSGHQPGTALSFEEEFAGYHQHVKDFTRDVLQVLDKIKVEKIHSSKVFENARKSGHQRVRDFYSLAEVLIKGYHNYLTDKSYLDFNDLSIQAVQLLKNQEAIRQYFQDKYQHVLVDEFQDVNSLQIELLQQLVTGQNNLFCVGDDWQGIYGFRGSDVRYIVDFETYFPGSGTIKLNLNYRSNQTIVEASNEVIRRNKYIVDKELVAFNKKLSQLNIYAADEAGIDDVGFVVKRVKKLLSEGYKQNDIMILYRRSKMYEPFKRALKEEDVNVTARTIHAAKGLESKVVFIIGLLQGYGGFPDIWYNDAIFQVIKKDQIDLMLEEERRLFYVALTRAREEINLVTLKGYESQFIDEIPLRYFTRPSVNFVGLAPCGRCGKPLEKGVNYCSYCGKKVK